MSKQTPPGWPRISSSVFYENAPAAIDWLCKAFGFNVRIKIEGDDGDIVHSELEYRDGLIMVGSTTTKKDTGPHRKSPKQIGGVNTQALFMYVDDVEAHCARARAAGARIVTEIQTNDYGDEYWTDRSYGAEDLEGHHWWFAERVASGEKSAWG